MTKHSAPSTQHSALSTNLLLVLGAALACAAALGLWLAGGRRAGGPAPAPSPQGDQAAPAEGVAWAVPPEPATELRYRPAGAFDSGLTGLSGIALDAEGLIYVSGAEGVHVLDQAGALVRAWSTGGPAQCVAAVGRLGGGPKGRRSPSGDPSSASAPSPQGDAAAGGGAVYVGLLHAVEVYDPQGRLVRSWGKEGRGAGELSVVTAIAVSGPDVFVADAGNRCVHRFDLTGDFIDEIGRRDDQAGVPGIVCPSPHLDCAVGADGNLVVANPGRLRVETYARTGELLGHWGTAGGRAEQFIGCCNPTNIALAPDGTIVTTEKDVPRVKVYSRDGRLLAYIGPQHFSKGAEGMEVAVDPQGRIYAADPGDGKVRVFAPEEGTEP